MKTALITGVNGQDGAYLTDLLLEKGYVVHGIKRRSSLINTSRIDHLYKDPHEKDVRFKLHYGDLTDGPSLIRIIQQTQPDEIYNLGAMSHVKVSGVSKFLFDVYYKLEKENNDKRILVALAKTGMVCYDYTAKKVAAVPKEVRDKLE